MGFIVGAAVRWFLKNIWLGTVVSRMLEQMGAKVALRFGMTEEFALGHQNPQMCGPPPEKD